MTTHLTKITLCLTFLFAAQFSKAQNSNDLNCHIGLAKVQKQVAEVTTKLILPEEEILRLPENEQSEFRQALGQLSFIAKEVEKDLAKISQLYQKKRISGEEYCDAITDADENTQAIEADLLTLVKKLAFNF